MVKLLIGHLDMYWIILYIYNIIHMHNRTVCSHTYIDIVLYVYTYTHTHMLPRWHSGKELTCQCRRWLRNSDLIPGLERIPVGRHSNSLQYSYLENPMDRRDWQAIVHRVTKSWTRLKQVSTHTHVHAHMCVHTHTQGSGLTWWLSDKESAFQCRWSMFNPWSQKTLCRRKWQPTPDSFLGYSIDRGAWQATVCGVAESDMTVTKQQ